MLTAEQVTKQIILDFKNIDFSDDQFYQLCQDNQDWRLELTVKGELVIMSPIGGISGKREADLITDLNLWNRRTQLGHVFSSSTVFRLPRGGKRSPDVAWVAKEAWASLTPEAQEKFPPICPNFVIELRSRTDALLQLQEKMQEYIDSGLQLGWLINSQDQQVEIYRPQQSVEIVQLPTQLSGENILPEFILDLANF